MNAYGPLKVLIAPDKFKGTLTALEAARAIASGWSQARPDDSVELLPMSDGGDGFGEVVGDLLGGSPRAVATVDAAHRPIEAQWWFHQPSSTAVIESARVIGLSLLPPGAFHPFDLDTFGLGALLVAARDAGARRCLVGVGGSATNDGGFGLARSLGWEFIGEDGRPFDRWTSLDRLTTVRAPGVSQWFEELIIAVDVLNPLLGPDGCSRVYGPQKGLTEFDQAERCLERLAEVVDGAAAMPGAGAAGGLGFGLVGFADGRIQPGFGVFARLAGLQDRVAAADLVITGEGSLDDQSLMGKGVGELAAMADRLGVACIALAGVIRGGSAGFAATHALTPEFASLEEALRSPAQWLERLAAHAAQAWG